jgi:hypothetical protein
MRTTTWTRAVLLAAACLAGLRGARAAATDTNGTFRFLTQTLPTGSTNTEYVARLVTANADGPVTLSVAAGSSLPAGLTLDGQTGYITGRPTSTANKSVTFQAFDGTNTITWGVTMHVNASGGGGNGGSTFGNVALAEGRVGAAYSQTVTVANGVGPYVFGALALPPGLTLDGATGAITGTPTAAGTSFISLSVFDQGESNDVVTVQPLTVLPASSDFRFTTTILNNGEVGTPFWDAYATSGGSGAVTYAASGLPPGLSVDAATGVVSGTPTAAGLFQPVLTARDSADTITTNLTMLVAPSATSSLYWDFSGIPTAFAGVSYSRQPPILVSAQNGTLLTYSAVGLPAGVTYNASTGELSGVSSDVGDYPVTFTATDSPSGAAISLSAEFLVLPPAGGDAGDIAVNLWTSRETLHPATPGHGVWTGACIYNADRRTGSLFDRAADGVAIGIGSRTIDVPSGSMTGTAKQCAYHTALGVKPAVSVGVSSTSQVIRWASTSDTLTETLPTESRLAVSLGSRGWLLDQLVGADGRFRAPGGFRHKAFVVAGGTIRVAGAAKDTATLSMRLADPAFAYQAGVSTLRVRLLDGANVLLDRDFTALGAATTSTDPLTHVVSTTVKTLKDAAVANRVTKFVYSTKTGRMTLALSALTLSSVTAPQEHLGVEITIGTRVAYTAVTFFAPLSGRYSTRM